MVLIKPICQVTNDTYSSSALTNDELRKNVRINNVSILFLFLM